MGSQQQQQPRLGITEPISLGGPSELDVIESGELEKYLQNAGLYETREGAVDREEVLGRLDQIVKNWVKTISRAKGLNEQLVEEANAKIFTFGSYRLGVHGPGADIDTLCVGPTHATREEDFFGELFRMLSEMPEVTELHPVPDAHVPVMKFKFNEVSIDLLYARLSLWVIPEIEKHTYNMLQCHPHPGDFSDKSRPLYCCYFMGLQRKQGVPVNEAEQFDIRGTVDEFKQAVNIYSTWKPGMEIRVTHVKRRSIPHFVFPGGVRPSRPSKASWDSIRAAEQKISGHGGADKSPDSKNGVSDSLDSGRKRKQADSISDADSRSVKIPTSDCSPVKEIHERSPPFSTVSSSSTKGGNHMVENTLGKSGTEKTESNATNIGTFYNISSQNCSIGGLLGCNPSGLAANIQKSSSNEEEKMAMERKFSGSYNNQQTLSLESEERKDMEIGNQVKDNGGSPKGSPMESWTPGPSMGLHLNQGSEELEVAELSVPFPNKIASGSVAPKKPLIRLSFTTIANVSKSG
ncbi:hypothetical protein ACFE04_009867 [Oxalis oulophora]